MSEDTTILPQGYYETALAFHAAQDGIAGATTSEALKWLSANGGNMTVAHVASVRRRLVGDLILRATPQDQARYVLTDHGVKAIRATSRAFARLAERADKVLPETHDGAAS
jgi:hypothetical protein